MRKSRSSPQEHETIDYVKQKGTLASYDGMLYMPDEFILDVDGTNPDNARQKTIGLGILLDDLCVPYQAYFSGTGFHLGIPGSAFRWKPAPNLHLMVKDANGPWAVYAEDIDGDGDVDVLSINEYDNTIVWYSNNGKESFKANTEIGRAHV